LQDGTFVKNELAAPPLLAAGLGGLAPAQGLPSRSVFLDANRAQLAKAARQRGNTRRQNPHDLAGRRL